jgi:hypothetical protein
MANTVTILADHRGVSRPRVVGDEYVVDAQVETTNYVVAGEVISAASLGLSRITCAVIAGYESTQFIPRVNVDTDGTYTSSSSITILYQTHDASNVAGDGSGDVFITVPDTATDLGMVRIRVWGLI